jgi:peptidoglycan/xylan/chitin deacetylase (PgdA/CDA1 family)
MTIAAAKPDGDIKRNSRAVFTLSLDCEGLWGVADNRAIIRDGVINDATLSDAYEAILAVLDENQLTATAAFVSCFASHSEVLSENFKLLERLAALNPTWFEAVLPAVRSGAMDGWRGAKFYRAMESAGMEMAWHGATHLPLWDATGPESMAIELELAECLFEALGSRPSTIVFPRNLVGNLDSLRSAGFDTYRAAPRRDAIGRLLKLAQEVNVRSSCDKEPARLEAGWRVSSSGSFLNWPSGVRSLIPISVTIARWKAMLRDAAEHGGSVHMWFHPHNFITAPKMKVAFTEIMRYAGQLVRRGDVANLTMRQSVAHLTESGAS